MSKRKSLKGTVIKNPHDSDINTHIIPIVVRMVTSPDKASIFSMTISLVFFKGAVIGYGLKSDSGDECYFCSVERNFSSFELSA